MNKEQIINEFFEPCPDLVEYKGRIEELYDYIQQYDSSDHTVTRFITERGLDTLTTRPIFAVLQMFKHFYRTMEGFETPDIVVRFLEKHPIIKANVANAEAIYTAFNTFISERVLHPMIIQDFGAVRGFVPNQTDIDYLQSFIDFRISPEGQYKHINRITAFLHEEGSDWYSYVKEPEMILNDYHEFLIARDFDNANQAASEYTVHAQMGASSDPTTFEMLMEYYQFLQPPTKIYLQQEIRNFWICPNCNLKNYTVEGLGTTVQCDNCILRGIVSDPTAKIELPRIYHHES